VPMLADVALPVGVPGCDTYKVGSLGGGTVVSGVSGSGSSSFLHEKEKAIKKSSANVRVLMRLFTDWNFDNANVFQNANAINRIKVGFDETGIQRHSVDSKNKAGINSIQL
ncbi:MAG: hypothetical protein ACK56I_09060, partial [bacterium]